MKTLRILLPFVLSLNITFVYGQVTERQRPAGWDHLVTGGRFMDRFIYMPDLGGITSDTWGAANVIPRDVNNGIEELEWSYWGGNIRKMSDGKYHLFVCRWREDSPKGHMEWPRSEVVHAVSDNSFGPFKVVDKVGKGHNPEWYITKDGKFVIYVIGGYYVSDNINGPWEYKKFSFNKRGRKVIEGLSNLSFAEREDGSFIMVCRGGGIWISRDGLSTWHQITHKSVYPPVDGRFEDPVIWKTENQYHLIVNDWYGRIAWYLRSKDGVNWKVDTGEAYLPGIAKYEDGTIENWFKFERIKVLQDKYGRATQTNFAVIDTLKHEDKPNDNHSSKNIVIPLLKGKLLSVLNKNPLTQETNKVQVLIKAEPDFNPNNDLDYESLKFGAPEAVDFGKGSNVIDFEKSGDDVVVTFDGTQCDFRKDNFAGKLIGKDKAGNLVFGYTRLPGVVYIDAILSARKPEVLKKGKALSVKIENFGQVSSLEADVQIFTGTGNELLEVATAKLSPIDPYQSNTLTLKTKTKLDEKESFELVVYINKGKNDEVVNRFVFLSK